MAFRPKDLLGIKELSKEDIIEILDVANEMKKIVVSGNKKTSELSGKSILMLFYENSTRTRMSFELASKYLGANSANIAVSASSVAKGETLVDTGRNLDAMGTDAIVIRHAMSGAPHLLAKNIHASVINAGDGMNEHPTQALLDFMTMREKKGSIEGLKVALIGDIYHSRVARSNIWGLLKLGAEVRIAGPSTLLPPYIEKTGVFVTNDVAEAVNGADVVMGLRIQLERQKSGLFPSVAEYSRVFGISEKVLKYAKEDALLMHPGPVNRGVELPTAVVDGSRSVIIEQVTNGVAVRMALLKLLIG